MSEDPVASGVAAMSVTPAESSSSTLEVPGHVAEVLARAKDFGEFRDGRCFRFLHLFSGPRNMLAEAIKRLGKAEGLKTDVLSMDKLGEGNVDLLQEHPFKEILEEAEAHSFDGAHAGFPCGSFSRARYKEGTGPSPVRSLQHMYGLPGNSRSQQAEADRGTILAVRSVEAVKAVLRSQRKRRVPQVGSLENPPGSDTQFEGPAWQLQEVKAFVKNYKLETALFNTCAFQSRAKTRWFKPGRFSGALEGLRGLAKKCTCPSWVFHESLVGKEKTSKAAQYPEELAEAYAKLVIQAFKLTLQLEWWRHMVKIKQDEVSHLQKKWLESKEKKQVGYNPDMDGSDPSKRAWSTENVTDDSRPEADGSSKKAKREVENEMYLGGMRNPSRAVMMRPRLTIAGKEIIEAWRGFVSVHPEALEVAKTYGSEVCKLDEKVTEEWIKVLERVMQAEEVEDKTVRDEIEFKSPLNLKLWSAWQRFSGDPDTAVIEWIKHGAPLGMAMEVPKCGIFPEVDDGQEGGMEAPEMESQLNLQNYRSVTEMPEEADKEIQRYVDAGFCLRMSEAQIKTLFPSGTISKLALIVKRKEDGSLKRRIIIDLLRSGGNSRARIRERIVLPRIVDVLESVRFLRYHQSLRAQHDEDDEEDSEGDTDDLELVTADLSDAYCHFAVHRSELKNCVSPSTKPGEHLLFRAMLFGFRGAPLIMGRFSSMLARLLQSCTILYEMNMQLYMDDPCMIFQGTPLVRARNLSLILYMCAAMGVKLAYHKGARGRLLTWIGVQIELKLAERVVNISIPQKMIKEITGSLQAWEKAGMVSMKDLRAVTGRLSWVAGILPRCRWAVSILYAVMTSCIQDNEKEIARATQRKDTRPKLGMVPVKRLELPRRWFLRMLQDSEKLATRKEHMDPQVPSFAIITDASPRGVGAH